MSTSWARSFAPQPPIAILKSLSCNVRGVKVKFQCFMYVLYYASLLFVEALKRATNSHLPREAYFARFHDIGRDFSDASVKQWDLERLVTGFQFLLHLWHPYSSFRCLTALSVQVVLKLKACPIVRSNYNSCTALANLPCFRIGFWEPGLSRLAVSPVSPSSAQATPFH